MGKRTPLLFWISLSLSIVLFYLISFGPLKYLTLAIGQRNSFGKAIYEAFAVLYAPHRVLAGQSQCYWEYTSWWSKLAIDETFVMTWEQYQALKANEALESTPDEP